MAYTKKIEIQRYTESEDEIGNTEEVWETLFEPWAKVEESGGKEYYAAAQTNSQNDVVFRIRYSSKLEGMLTSELRIVFRGVVYDVKHISGLSERAPELAIRTELLNGGKRSAPEPEHEPEAETEGGTS